MMRWLMLTCQAVLAMAGPLDHLTEDMLKAPQVQAFYHQRKEADHKLEHAKSANWPHVHWTQHWYPWGGARPYGQEHTHEITATWILWSPERHHTIQTAYHTAQLEQARHMARQRQWIQKALLLHIQHSVSKAQVATQAQWIKALSAHHHDAQIQHASGLISDVGILEAQAQLDQAQAQIQSSEAHVKLLQHQLESMLQHPVTTTIPLVHTPQSLPEEAWTTEALIQKAKQHNPELQATQHTTHALHHAWHAHRHGLTPRLHITLQHGKLALWSNTLSVTSETAKHTRLGVWFSWHLTPPALYHHADQHNWQAAQHHHTHSAQRLAHDIADQHAQLKHARLVLEATQQKAQSAHAQARAVQSALWAQVRTHAHLLTAMSQAHDADLAVLTQRARILEEAITLLGLLGTPPQAFINAMQTMVWGT